MIRRLSILNFLVALRPILAPAELAALNLRETYNQYQALYEQGR